MHEARNEDLKMNSERPLKTTLTDLHSILFEQLERLSNPDLTGDELLQEIRRGQAISGISAQIIQNGNLALRAVTAKLDIPTNEDLPGFLDVGRPVKCIERQKK